MVADPVSTSAISGTEVEVVLVLEVVVAIGCFGTVDDELTVCDEEVAIVLDVEAWADAST